MERRPIDEGEALRVLGAAVRRERLGREWTLEKLAEATGLDAPQLSRIEAGQTNITMRTLVRLANGLGIGLRDLLPA